MTQQDIHPDPTRTNPGADTNEQPPAHQWFGEPTGATRAPLRPPASPVAVGGGAGHPDRAGRPDR